MKRSQVIVVLFLSLITVSSSLTVNLSLADTPQPHGVITLTFDDSWQSQYDYAFPLMQARGMVGTFYEITNRLSTNATGGMYLTIPELQTMQNAGDEIGSHSVDHPDFQTLSTSQITYEAQTSKQFLQSYGLNVNNFAYPFGSYNATTDSIVTKYYRSDRDVYCPGNVSQLPYTSWHVTADDGAPGDPGCLASLESIVNQVYSTNEWAVLYFHEILPNVVNSLDVINNQTFASFLDYVKSKGIPTLTINEALNLVSAPSSPPSVTISPTSAKIDIGQSVTFSSSVSGGNLPISYQWYLNNSAVLGATNDTWVFTPSSTGNYVVNLNVTDGLDYQVESNMVTDLTVYPQPTVLISPSSLNMATGTAQTLSSTISGGASPYNYQWYQNGLAISGATGANYAFKPMLTGIYSLYLNITDTAGITPSSNNSTVVVETPLNVAVTPTHVGIYAGQSQTFSSTVSGGTTPYVYQWVLNGSAVVGADGAAWVFSPSSTGQFNVYLNVTDGLNLETQSNVVSDISVYSPLTVSVGPGSADLSVGGVQQFSCSVLGGVAPFVYQWYYANGTVMSGATTSGLTYTANAAGDLSIYLNVTDSLNTKAQSNIVTINVTPSSTDSPTSTPADTSTSSPTATPTHAPKSTPTNSVTPSNLSNPVSSELLPYYVAGLVAVIVIVIVVADALVIRKRQLSSSYPPPPPP